MILYQYMSQLLETQVLINIYMSKFVNFIIKLGIPDGKFLERKRFKNQERQNNFFTPADLIVGKDVKINGFSFHLEECDEFTRKWYVENFKE